LFQQEKRKKAQAIQRKNETPHRLSRGGYLLLEQRIMEEKLKQQMDSTGSNEGPLNPPSPPNRHEKWKLARTKPGGQMTSEKSKIIAERIVS